MQFGKYEKTRGKNLQETEKNYWTSFDYALKNLLLLQGLKCFSIILYAGLYKLFISHYFLFRHVNLK